MKTKVGILMLGAVLMTSVCGDNSAPVDTRAGDEREIAGVKFCWVPGGKFMMGSPVTEADRGRGEDQVEVEVTGFWMAKYETTQEAWEAVMGGNPSEFKGAKLPVEKVSWEEAGTYAGKVDGKLGAETKPAGWQVRLPTEAEWEYACRGGTKTPFYWGASAGSDKANFNGGFPYGGAAKGVNLLRTTDVGSYERAAPHPWGLGDMHGNVWEWCLDGYQEGLPGGKDPLGAPAFRVFRGGSWDNNARGCRAANRFKGLPSYRGNFLGFRLVLSPVKPGE